MSAHSASHRGGWLSALVAQVSDYVFEAIDETVEPQPPPLEPQPVVAVVASAARAGASTVARLLAAELAARADGSATVLGAVRPRRGAPPSRAAIRLSTALTGIGKATPSGRLCIIGPGDATPGAPALPAATPRSGAGAPDAPITRVGTASVLDREAVVKAARYVAPVVLDLPADGSAAGIAQLVDRIVVIADAGSEPALLDAVAEVVGGDPIKVANRVSDPARWTQRADVVLPDARLAARAAALGTKARGALGSGVSRLADLLEAPR